jgi:FdhE protein
MQRILDPARIEAFAHRSIPRIRLPERASVFAQRGERLRTLAAQPVGQPIAEYLRLMGALADAQHSALSHLQVAPPSAAELAQARQEHRPPAAATGGPYAAHWRGVLAALCDALIARREFPAAVYEVCNRLRAAPSAELEAQAGALLATPAHALDAAAAPFVMAALQVCWTHTASSLAPQDVTALELPGLCPVCGTLPVASIVRVDHGAQGYRYLHCPLCASEWHLVRVTCSQCQATKGVAYHSIEGGPQAIRAESCDHCKSYRKILYQEQDMGSEPVADDLASLALDLLMSEAGYHRASGNPLLWQRPSA